MECLYFSQILSEGELAELDKEEAKHVRALRLRVGDRVLLTNGSGFIYNTTIVLFDKIKLVVKIEDILPKHGETNRNIHLFMGLIDNRDRLEFCIEKAVECGVNEITFFKSAYSSHKIPNIHRLESKAIAAIKQCKRSVLPKINFSQNLKNFEKIASTFDNILLADLNGNKFDTFSLGNNIAILVGPEGGFNEQELDFISSFKQYQAVNLGERRLRAETAAIAMCVLCSNL